MKIEDLAEVMRFQDRREAAYEGEEPGKDGEVWDEVKIESFDPLTGFVMPEGLGRVGLFRGPRKFALRKSDILIYFNGAREKLGVAGLIVDDMRAVSARSLCMVRTFRASDALPLFFFLREPTVRRDLVKFSGRDCEKVTKSFLTLEAIRAYEIDPVFLKGLAKSEDKMLRLIEGFRDARKAQKKALDAILEDMYASTPEGWENWGKD